VFDGTERTTYNFQHSANSADSSIPMRSAVKHGIASSLGVE